MEEKGIVKDYFTYLALEATNEEFTNEVKAIAERENNDWMVDRLKYELQERLNFFDSLVVDEKSNSKEIVENISKKLGILMYYFDTLLDNKNIGEAVENEKGKVKILFARNKAGNIMFLRNLGDIKKYSEDKYALTISLLDKFLEDHSNTKALNLKGVYEISSFNIHIFYMYEGEYVVLIGANINNNDKDIRYIDSIINMRRQSEEYRLDLRREALDMEEELEKAKEYYKTLRGTLERRS